MTELSDLVQGPGERAIVYGGTRTGKSSYMDWSMRHIQEERPTCMQLVLDTKPRFRAETIAYGPRNAYRKSAAHLYESWAAGPVVPNSVAVDFSDAHPFRGMWNHDKRPGEIVICQSGNAAYWRVMNMLAHHFVEKEVKNRERLLVVDEGLDFYQRNTLGIDARHDVILRTARAGGERNIGLLFGAHRPYGVPPLLNTLSSRVTLFHLRYEKDIKYLWDMGIPETERSPSEEDGDYVFKQFRVRPGGHIAGPWLVRLNYPQSYLKQLSAT